MDFRRLEVFCKVIECASFTKAAESVFLTQPTVSEHIRALEDRIGVRLLDRLGREVLPTSAGKILYEYAKKMLRLREESLQALSLFRNELVGDLVLGASTIPGTYILPPLIGDFKEKHPHVHIRLSIGNTGHIVKMVLRGEVEMGLAGYPVPDRRLAYEPVFSDELVLAVHPQHEWAQVGMIPLQSLQGEPFIQRQQGSGTRMLMERVLRERGFDPSRLHSVAEMGSTEAVRQGIKARIGVSILSRRAIEEDVRSNALCEIAIQGIQFRRTFFVVSRKNRTLSPLCLAFLGDLKTASNS